MTDPFSWSIDLGRWSGIRVRIHLLLVFFALAWLLGAALEPAGASLAVAETACWLALLVLALMVHELGHAAMAVRLGVEPEEVRLWPLGNLVGPAPTPLSRSPESFLVALAGPATSLAVAVAVGLGLALIGAQPVWNPFGHDGGGAPLLGGGRVAPAFGLVWAIGWFGFLNWILFLANLIPALPLDGGRALRALLAGQPKDSMVAPWTAHSFAALLGLVGLFRLFPPAHGGGLWLISLAVLIEMMVRLEARMLEDGGFFDEGVFGYDFSEGYTSLEAGAPKVRPYRESALKRWRRRRSELRRQRRQAQDTAEEQRMDEILAKLHREGRAALTDEEHRFLIRVSAKYRARHRAQHG
ncbi:MAG TPA: site-2 protease family protein [Isosphaeraceae bacterium]